MARFLVDHGLVPPAPCSFGVDTRGGLKDVSVAGGPDGHVTVGMGRVRHLPGSEPITVAVEEGGATREWHEGYNVDVGNPHCIVFVGAVGEAGSLLEPPRVRPPGVYPNGVNVEFVERGANHQVSFSLPSSVVVVFGSRSLLGAHARARKGLRRDSILRHGRSGGGPGLSA
jgi:diaminopimelate epimerase